MNISFYLLAVYLFGAILMAFFLLWRMVFSLDASHWEKSKRDIWEIFILHTMLWPLTFLNPDNRFDPIKSALNRPTLKISNLKKQMREEKALYDNPPPCGNKVLSRQRHARYEETFSEINFRSAGVESKLMLDYSDKLPMEGSHEAGIMKWLQLRNEDILEPTEVPDAWWEFQYVADDMLRAGFGEVFCLKCKDQVSIQNLVSNDDHFQPGWNFNRLLCPEQHHLLVVEKMHIMLSRAKEE